VNRPELVEKALERIRGDVRYLDGSPVYEARPGERLDQWRALLDYIEELEKRPLTRKRVTKERKSDGTETRSYRVAVRGRRRE